MRKGAYAGSFDPPTKGHSWMIEEGAKLFDELIVAVGTNPEKSPKFTLEERLQMLQEMTEDLPNVYIDSFENQYLINYADEVGAQYILRGIRSSRDYEYEKEMRQVNSDLNADVTTVFLIPPRNISEITSSLVRGLVGYEEWKDLVKKYVPPTVYKKLIEKEGNVNPNAWEKLWNRIGAQGESTKVREGLVKLYSEPHRSYHNLVHIDHCLDEFKKVYDSLINPDEVEFALWFHDIIYDPTAKNNEEKSASFAYETSEKIKLPHSFAQKVNDLILATKPGAIPEESDAKNLVDIDMSILGMPPEEFKSYEEMIRKEYVEYGQIPEEQFKNGRIVILQEFLERPTIYLTDFFQQKYESRARANLKHSVSNLSCK